MCASWRSVAPRRHKRTTSCNFQMCTKGMDYREKRGISYDDEWVLWDSYKLAICKTRMIRVPAASDGKQTCKYTLPSKLCDSIGAHAAANATMATTRHNPPTGTNEKRRHERICEVPMSSCRSRCNGQQSWKEWFWENKRRVRNNTLLQVSREPATSTPTSLKSRAAPWCAATGYAACDECGCKPERIRQ